MRGSRRRLSRLLAVCVLVLVAVGAAGNEPPDCSPAPVECFGEACSCAEPEGRLVVTEIMPMAYFPEVCPEWFEVYNPGAADVDLAGWRFEDPTTGAAWTVPLDDATNVVRAGRYRWFAAFTTFYCGFSPRPDKIYGFAHDDEAFSLGLHEGGMVVVDRDGVAQDRVVWDRTWGIEVGRSLALVDPQADNALRANWRTATERLVMFGGYPDFTLYGTPGWAPDTPEPATDRAACDDANPCTVDWCLAAGGCSHVLSDAPCDDGDPCTDDDRCVWGPAGAICAGDDAPRCADACEEGAPCDDGDPCTVDDWCDGGRCRGVLPSRHLDCDDPNAGLVLEGLCLPDLGGFAYPLDSWWVDDPVYRSNPWEPAYPRCEYTDECGAVQTHCGAVTCWERTGQCVIMGSDPGR